MKRERLFMAGLGFIIGIVLLLIGGIASWFLKPCASPKVEYATLRPLATQAHATATLAPTATNTPTAAYTDTPEPTQTATPEPTLTATTSFTETFPLQKQLVKISSIQANGSMSYIFLTIIWRKDDPTRAEVWLSFLQNLSSETPIPIGVGFDGVSNHALVAWEVNAQTWPADYCEIAVWLRNGGLAPQTYVHYYTVDGVETTDAADAQTLCLFPSTPTPTLAVP